MTPTTTEKTAAKPEQFPKSRDELVKLMREVYQQEKNAAGKKVLTLAEIKEQFKALPDEKDRIYELKIAGFARDWADFIIKRIKKDDPEPLLLQLLSKHEADPAPLGSEEEKCAFAAFAVAINYERLQKNPREEKNLLNSYRKLFKDHIFFLHLDVLYRMDEAKINHADDFLRNLLNDAKRNSDNLKEDPNDNNIVANYGGLHAFAETVALVFENASDKLREELLNDETDWLKIAKKDAQDAIDMDIEYEKNKAIKEALDKAASGTADQSAEEQLKKISEATYDAYAKFYCTRGRIEALRGELEAAIESINEAIKLEKNTRTDYSIRIGQYASYEQQFRAQQKLQIQERAMADQMYEMNLLMEQQEKESMAKNMEFLGLFSGIVSFTIGSLTITGAIAEQSIKHAAGLIVVLMGALMCVFAAFGIILHGFFTTRRSKKKMKLKPSFIFRHLFVFILGLLVVYGGIQFCLK